MRLSTLRFAAVTTSILWGVGASQAEEKVADRFAKWEATISAFEEADKKNPPNPGQVLFTGSSSIRMWDTAAAFPEVESINRGFGGSTTAEVNHFAGRMVTPYRAGTIVLYAGDNDVQQGLSAEEVAADFREFVGLAREGNPEVRIIYIAIKPSVARWKLWPTMLEANRLIAEVCAKDPRMEFADVSKVTLGEDGKPRPELFKEDGLHLNSAGYEAWKTVVAPLLRPE